MNAIPDVENAPGYTIIRFSGFVDASIVEKAKPMLLKEIPAACRNFIVDLARVDFLDSHGIGLFVTLLKKAHMNSGRIFFAGAGGQPAAVLEMVGLSGPLVVYCKDEGEALALLDRDTGKT